PELSTRVARAWLKALLSCLAPSITMPRRLIPSRCPGCGRHGVRLPSLQDSQNAADELGAGRCQQAAAQQDQRRLARPHSPPREFHVSVQSLAGVVLDMPLSAPECGDREVRVDAVEQR